MSPANPEPGAGIWKLVVRAPFVQLEAKDSLVERQRPLQVLHKQSNMVHSLVDHSVCSSKVYGSIAVPQP